MKFLSLGKLCDGVNNSYECFNIIENHPLKKYPGVVKGNDSRLFLSLENGKQKFDGFKTYKNSR